MLVSILETDMDYSHRRRTGWNFEGDAWRAPILPNVVGYGEGCPLSGQLRGLRERRELPQRGAGQSIWRILKATERSLFTSI